MCAKIYFPPSNYSRRLRIGCLTVAGSVALFGVGFLFHTSHAAVVLGKYNGRYACALLAYFLLLVPGTFFLTRFLFATHEIHFRSGRRALIRPARKIQVLLLIVLISVIAGWQLVKSRLADTTITHARDQFHPYLQNTPRPNNPQLNTNRWGFRGAEISRAKPKGVYRIFVFGGSTVFCGRVPYDQSHCKIMERRLQDAFLGRTIQVQNVGGEWHCSQHSVIKLLSQVQDFSPDLVVLTHGINDLVRSFEAGDFSEGSYRTDYGHYHGAVVNLRRPTATALILLRSAAGHWFSDFRYQQVRLLGPEGKGLNGMITTFFPKARIAAWDDWKSLASFRRNMTDFVQIARSKNIDVLLASQPFLYRDDLSESEQEVMIFPLAHQFEGRMASIHSMKQGMDLFNETARGVAADHGVRFLDLESSVPKSLEFFYDEVHYTAKGNQVVGEALANYIIRAGIITDP